MVFASLTSNFAGASTLSTIGSLSKDTLVLMGLQPNVGPLIRETIPEIIATFKKDGVEAALLVPS